MNRTIGAIIILAATAAPLAAELETTVDLTVLALATRADDGRATFSFIGKGSLLFSALANPNVKAECELAGIWSETLVTGPGDILKRLNLKVDFGGAQLLAGKARVSWGDGFVFNAGDLLFGSLTPMARLSDNVLRDDTDWLINLTLPLGDFTYLEGIVLPFSPLHPVDPAGISPYDLRGGGRFVTKLGGLKLEADYLFRADDATHNAAFGVQGNLFFDAYLTSSLSIPAAAFSTRTLRESWAVTAGLFRLFPLEDGSAFSVRLEAALRPFGLWKEPAAPAGADVYGLFLYPELAWSPSEELTLQVRAVIHPVGGSGLVSVGASFSPYQGLSLLGHLWSMWGDADDAWFGLGREADIGLFLGLNFIY